MHPAKMPLLVLLGAGILSGPGWADEHERFHDRHDDHRAGWHGDIHRFSEHDLELWRGGRWIHSRHDGRLGWWWIVAGTWYFYPAPVYPYPDPYQPPVVVSQPAPATPVWYYCGNPAGYYPYVPRCAIPWQTVPAAPSAAGPPP